MPETSTRLALLLTASTGVAILWSLPELARDGSAADFHRNFILAAVAAWLLLAPWVPRQGLPAIATALLVKISGVAASMATEGVGASELLQISALAIAGGILWRAERLEARWNGMLSSRQEGW